MIKKILSIITIFTIIMLCNACVYARDVKYKIDEIGMSIDFDSSIIVFTKNTSVDYKYLSYVAMSYDELMDYMDINNICLQAQTKDSIKSLAITTKQNDTTLNIFNLSEISDNDLQYIIQDFVASKEYINCKQETINDILYLCMDFSENTENGKKNGILYYTVVNGNEIIFTLQTSETLTDELHNNIKQIIETVQFDDIQKNIQSQEISIFEKVIIAVIIILLVLAIITTAFICLVIAPRKKYKQQLFYNQKISKNFKKTNHKTNKKIINNSIKSIDKLSNKRKISNYKKQNYKV